MNSKLDPAICNKFSIPDYMAFCERYRIIEGEAQRIMLHHYIQSLGAGGRPGIKAEPRKLARGKNLQPITKRVGTPDAPLTN